MTKEAMIGQCFARCVGGGPLDGQEHRIVSTELRVPRPVRRPILWSATSFVLDHKTMIMTDRYVLRRADVDGRWYYVWEK